MNKFEFNKLCPFKWFVLENFPFIEADFDAITNYQLYCKVVEYLNKVIENNNAIGIQTENLTNAFIELQNYVNNYFENLDVQDEINNKLDEMAEAGTLEEIISSYINTNAILGFNTVDNLKNATNLINGSFAKTLGFYIKNDGGQGLYKIRTITNQDVVDEMLILSLSDENLVAELIINDNTINLKQIGVKADDNNFNNNSDILSTIFNRETKYKFYLPEGEYKITTTINLTRRCDNFIFFGDGHKSDQGQKTGSILNYSGNGYCIEFEQRCWRSQMFDFDIICENGSGIHFNENISGSKFTNINIKVKNIGLKIDRSGYSYWHRIDILDNENSTDFKAIECIYNGGGSIEYLYFTECTFASYYGTYTDGDSYGIYSNHLNHCYIQDCDFVRLNYCFYLASEQNSKEIYITKTNFIAKKCNIYLKSKANSIGGVYILGNSFSIYDNNARVLKTEREGSYYTRGLIYDNNHIADITSGITTDTLIEIAVSSLQLPSCIINNNGYNANNVSFITLPSTARNYNPISHSFVRPVNIRLSNNGTFTTYTYTFSSNSPFSETPGVLVTDTKGLVSDYSVSNTQNGNLSVTINFSESWNGGNFVSIHILCDAKNELITMS